MVGFLNLRPHLSHLNNQQYLYPRPNVILLCSLLFALRYAYWNSPVLFSFFILIDCKSVFSLSQKPSLLCHLFDIYGRSPKAVKQVLPFNLLYANFDAYNYWSESEFCMLIMPSWCKFVQCIHWHIPSLVRNLGSSCSEMLDIIHNSPESTDHLVTLVFAFYLWLPFVHYFKKQFCAYSIFSHSKDSANINWGIKSFVQLSCRC
jgi:hypothetical protein